MENTAPAGELEGRRRQELVEGEKPLEEGAGAEPSVTMA